MGGFVIVLLVILGAGLLGLVIWAIARHRYVESLRAKGWTFITSPQVGIISGMNVPPFGVGFGRGVDDQIVGRAQDGTPFSAFRYKSSAWSTAGYAIAMPLGKSLPAGEVAHVSGPQLPLPGHTFSAGPVRANAEDPQYAQELLAAIAPGLQGPWRITVDHTDLILIDAAKEADQLDRAIQALAQMRGAVLNSPAALRVGPPPPQGLSFFQHPDWVYVPRDDNYLSLVAHSTGGSAHTAHDIIYSDNGGLPFLRLRHDWQTTRTVTDSDGNSRTVTDNHSETICEFRTTFPFRPLDINWGWFGTDLDFEWREFNERFKVGAHDRRFASHVIHQRQMEFLMSLGHPSFSIQGDGRIRLPESSWQPIDLERADYVLRGFFARVPDFVWQDLGAWPRPIAEIEG